MVVHLARSLAEQMMAEAERAAPEEICGVLLGKRDIITAVVPIPNIAASRARAFVLEPAALIQAFARAEAAEQEVIGFYHSHPKHGAQPSPTDIREWHYPDLLMVIVGAASRKVAAWQVRGVEATPVELVFSDTPAAPEIPLSNAGKIAIIVSVVLAILAVLVVSLTLLPPAPPIP